MNKKIILLTGSELRHDFFRKYISIQDGINVLASFCESTKGNLLEIVKSDNQPNELRKLHLITRGKIEKDFFEVFCNSVHDTSNPVFIEKGEINSQEHILKIIDLNPDLIVSYGCSLIKSRLINSFKGKFINIHLGLSPYYRGSGTNFWPFVNNELQFIGTTFMHIDEGVDTGEIIHQIRAKIHFNDSIHQVGNRLIKDSAIECVKLIRGFDELKKMSKIEINSEDVRYFRKVDFKEEHLLKAYENLSKGMIVEYLRNQTFFEEKYPIIENPSINSL